MIRRREFNTLLGGAAAAWPSAARAQQRAVPEIAFFNAGPRATQQHFAVAFREGLREHGFIEGQNLAIEYRYANDQYDQLPAIAAELVQRRVALIAAAPRAVDAAKAATSTIPIVFQAGGDPVSAGLVASLNRPGGNLTGVTILASDLTAKRFGLLHQAIPQAMVIGVLLDRMSPRRGFIAGEIAAAARTIGIRTRVIEAGNVSEIDGAFNTMLIPLTQVSLDVVR